MYIYIKKRQCLQWGQALPTAMATTVSSSVSTGSSDLASLSQNINNAADISVIVIYFVVVLAVGIWVCESPARFLGGHKNCRGKHLMLGVSGRTWDFWVDTKTAWENMSSQ